MKIVNDLKIGGKEITRNGCFCNSNSVDTRGPWHPFWFCNCGCGGDSSNQSANKSRANNA